MNDAPNTYVRGKSFKYCEDDLYHAKRKSH